MHQLLNQADIAHARFVARPSRSFSSARVSVVSHGQIVMLSPAGDTAAQHLTRARCAPDGLAALPGFPVSVFAVTASSLPTSARHDAATAFGQRTARLPPSRLTWRSTGQENPSRGKSALIHP
jgi:hypothetical protein